MRDSSVFEDMIDEAESRAACALGRLKSGLLPDFPLPVDAETDGDEGADFGATFPDGAHPLLKNRRTLSSRISSRSDISPSSRDRKRLYLHAESRKGRRSSEGYWNLCPFIGSLKKVWRRKREKETPMKLLRPV
jgi:hypothetical protein